MAPDEQPGAAEPVQETDTGNGVVVVGGIFESGAVVELRRVEGPHIARAEHGTVVGRRTVDEDGNVGFDGLIPGDYYFACGYDNGKYLEVRCVAVDPIDGVPLLQQPVQPSPTLVGTSETTVTPQVPEAPGATLESGLPVGVTSSVLGSEPEGPPADQPAVPEAAPATAAVEPAPGTVAEPVTPAVPEATAPLPDAPPAEAPAPAADAPPEAAPVADAPPADTAPTVEEQAPAEQTPAPDTPTATDPAAEPEPVAAAEPVADTPPADAASAAEPVVDAGGASTAPTPDVVPPGPTPLQQLVAQATELGVPNAETLTEDELRKVITEKSFTPVA